MSESKPLLTISLLSSGRSETIERCLSSFDQIREKIETEVIIVDTDPGHREDVQEILRRYADQIIPFEWCDDFAKARNVGIEAARGEWFLNIDDDEWFLEADPLIRFFSSSDCEKYQWANFQLRNYRDPELEHYTETWISRLFKMEKGLRFVGRIHEYVAPVIGRPVNLPVLIGHTGYVYLTEEEQHKHALRNLKGLEKLMKEEPNQVRWYFQAMCEYDDLGDREKEDEVARKGYEILKGAKGYQSALMRGPLAANQVRLLALDENWEECERLYNRLMAGDPLGKVSQAQMELNAAQATYYLNKTKQARKHCLRYMKLHESVTRKPVEYANEYLAFQSVTLREDYYAIVAVMLMCIDIESGDWSTFEKYFDTVLWGGNGKFQTPYYERKLLFTVFKCDYDGHYPVLIEGFWKTDSARKTVKKFLKDGMAQGADRAGDKHFWNLVRAVAEADVTEHIPWDVRILWAERLSRMNGYNSIVTDLDSLKNSGNTFDYTKEAMRGYFRNMFASSNPLLVSPEIWRIGLNRGATLDERIHEIPLERWVSCVDSFADKVDGGFMKQIADIIDDVFLGMDDERYGYFMLKTMEPLKEYEQKKQIEEERRHLTQQEAIKAEMRQIIEKLEEKVEYLIFAGLNDEAEKVMKEIQKYSLPDR